MDVGAGNTLASELAAESNRCLREPGMMDTRRFEAFLEAQRAVGLVHGARPLCRHLRPLLVAQSEYRKISEAAERVTSALWKIAARSRADEGFAKWLGLTATERELASIDPGYPELVSVGRLDMLVDASGFSFIELNADSPAGITDQLLAERVLLELPHLANVRAHPHVHALHAQDGLLASLRGAYQGFGGTSTHPTIAIVDWSDVDTQPELYRLADFFRASGHPCSVVDPRELVYTGGRLSANGVDIDLVYRRVITTELIERLGCESALLRAYRDRRVCVANSLRTKAVNKKAGFAALSDPAYSSLFSTEERAAIAAHVPWTRCVRPGPTEWRGRTIELLDLLRSEPEHFVLKPNDDYGGHGVLLGWETAAQEWSAALAASSEALFVVQERRASRTTCMPTFRDGGLVEEEVYFDLCPFLFAGRVGGLMARVSSSAVTNISAGGCVSGLFVVGDEAPRARVEILATL